MLLKNGTIVTPFELLRQTDVRISGDRITGIGHFVPDDAEEVIDVTGLYVCPGFVDIHTHGGYGGDFMDATDAALEQACAFHAANGTTCLLATSVTAPIDQITDMIDAIRSWQQRPHHTCRILGAHIEGPYISYKNKGAQHEQYLRIPDRDDYSFILQNSDVVRTVTIAPELPGAARMAADLKACGIKVCGGHDDGERDLILPVIDAGLSHCTHLWCAMSGVAMRDGVRNVGLTELGLIDDRLTVELIADNHHITPDMVRLVYKCKGADQMCVVSDCLRAGGKPADGTLYILGTLKDPDAQKFIVSDGVARLPDGSRYAGSIQPLSQMVRNLIVDSGIPVVDAVRMASHTPARIIGVSEEYGSVSVGKHADFCLMDQDFRVVQTLIDGKAVSC